ncbi:MAG: HepT-like ribonuclease domain-containing protein [Candidatus Vogelbacteria bacterium]
MDIKKLTAELTDYFKKRDDVAFAYLFGSVVKGTTHLDSDVDIGVYFTPKTPGLEYEAKSEYPGESEIWSDIEKITKRETDLVVLNRASVEIFFSVINQGLKLFSRNDNLLIRLQLAISILAEDFRNFVSRFVAIKERSKSLSPIDRDRLERLIDFLSHETVDFKRFSTATQQDYQHDVMLKRALERWAENIVNSSIDIAQILLASAKRSIPQTYKSILQDLAFLPNFDKVIAESLAEFTHMRNILAHEYLDIRFSLLSKFIATAPPAYNYLINFCKEKLQINKSDK